MRPGGESKITLSNGVEPIFFKTGGHQTNDFALIRVPVRLQGGPKKYAELALSAKPGETYYFYAHFNAQETGASLWNC